MKAVKKSIKVLFFFTVLVQFFACAVERPGEGKRSVRGYFMAQPIIDALEKFKKDSTYYPSDLYALVPKYMADFPSDASKLYLIYDTPDTVNGYVLQFKYYGPGANICNYTPTEKWKCYGYY
jgi:hypothetical protein